MAIKLKIGPPVIGEDFFGRWNELKKAEVLIQDNNLMLAAPRRVGKTSFARRLKDVQSAKGWNIPFFIQLIVSRLPVGKVSKANIDEAYNKLLQTGSFDTWYERLSKEYGRNKDIAKLVLKYLCVCTEGKKRDDIFNHIYAKYPSFESDDMGLLLRALMNDGYLVKDREQYRFRSPLLRDYWKETYC